MADTTRARLSLEIEAGDPISGLLSAEDGTPRRFSGWIELTRALEEATQGLSARPDA